MKYGIAGIRNENMERAKIAKELGFSFVETSLAYYAAHTEAQAKDFADYLGSVGMPCVSTNGMFPPEIKLIGKEADRERIKDYLEDAFTKIKPFGTSVCVLGSGDARTVAPEDLEKAYDEFSELVSETIAPIIEKYGKTLAIEPLNKKECNIVNTVEESMRIVRAVNKPSVRTLIDLYHVRQNGEDISTFAQYKGFIKHVHIAGVERKYPKPCDGEDYKSFIDVLRKAEYKEENVSVEADAGENFAESAKNTISVLLNL